jgi:hydroxymethylpyrimidine/phosphomethylpyrimidine kinase
MSKQKNGNSSKDNLSAISKLFETYESAERECEEAEQLLEQSRVRKSEAVKAIAEAAEAAKLGKVFLRKGRQLTLMSTPVYAETDIDPATKKPRAGATPASVTYFFRGPKATAVVNCD